MTNNKNTFLGVDGLFDYLKPNNNNPTPIVELPPDLNPFYHKGVRIFAKLMGSLPLTNVKSLPAYNMLLEASSTGKLAGKDTLIENSSGNTVYSLAVLAKYFGIPKTTAFVSNEISQGKLNTLRFFNVRPIVNKEPICPNPADQTSGIYKAKQMAESENIFNPGQYDNPANPQAHYKWTGQQLWDQLDGKIDLFCCGLGTTGTLVGTSKYLKEKHPGIDCVGVVRSPNNPVPGPRTKNLLNQIDFNWQKYVDHIEEVGTIDSYKYSLDLCRSGLIVGPSSGFAYKGLINYLSHLEKQGKLSKDKILHSVFICCDQPFIYLQEYFKYLGSDYFPEIQNANLLQYEESKQNNLEHKNFGFSYQDCEIQCDLAFKKIYNKQGDIYSDTVVYDIRTRSAFHQFHLPHSINTTEEELLNLAITKKTQVFLICDYGFKSLDLAIKLNTKFEKNQLKFKSIKGGTLEWSNTNLPREQNKLCKLIVPKNNLSELDFRKHFPFFSQHQDVVYLDSAATSQKPQRVIDEVNKYLLKTANPGRNSFGVSLETENLIEANRLEIANFFGAKSENIAFTSGATEAMNIITRSLAENILRDGDEILICRSDHQATILPWLNLAKHLLQKDIKISIKNYVLEPFTGLIRLANLQSLITNKTRFIVLTHAHNVFGTINPITEIIGQLPKHITTVLDISQTAGHININFDELGVDLAIFSGHKMFALEGIGGLLAKDNIKDSFTQIKFGGGLGNINFPNFLEVGTKNTCGIISLGAATKFIQQIGLENIHQNVKSLSQTLLTKLQQIDGLEFMPGIAFDPNLENTGIISFKPKLAIDKLEPVLQAHQINLRVGKHCTQELPASVRVSLHGYNNLQDIDSIVKVIKYVQNHIEVISKKSI